MTSPTIRTHPHYAETERNSPIACSYLPPPCPATSSTQSATGRTAVRQVLSRPNRGRRDFPEWTSGAGMDIASDRTRTYVTRALELFAGYGERAALVQDDRRISYRELRDLVHRMAATLRAYGVRSGASVLIMVANPLEGPVLQLAVHLLGCRSFWVAPVTARREILEYVRRYGADAFVFDPRTQGGLGAEIAASLEVPVFCLGPGGPGPDLLANSDNAEGTPKLVHLPHAFFLQVLAIAEGQFTSTGAPLLRHLTSSPMWLVSGQITAFVNLFTGVVLFLEDAWTAERFLATV